MGHRVPLITRDKANLSESVKHHLLGWLGEKLKRRLRRVGIDSALLVVALDSDSVGPVHDYFSEGSLIDDDNVVPIMKF